mgnify:CR=1 FL=1
MIELGPNCLPPDATPDQKAEMVAALERMSLGLDRAMNEAGYKLLSSGRVKIKRPPQDVDA